MTGDASFDAAEIQLRVQVAALARAALAQELADLGINASPADIEWYLSMSPKERQNANMAWLVLNTSYTRG